MEPKRPLEKENKDASRAWSEHPWAQAGLPSASRSQPASRGQAWSRLPVANQLLFAGGFGFLGLGALLLMGPTLVQGAQAAVFPYTGEGKRQSCLSNLESLSRAFALYAQDSDGHLPLVEEKATSTRARLTWVTRLQPYTERQNSSSSVWGCPLGTTPAASDASTYGLNPILAGAPLPEGEDAAGTLLLGDRGTRDDLSLLPPLPGWNAVAITSSATGSTASPVSLAFDAATTNLDFRHDAVATGVFADGHAGMLSPSETSALPLWGGSAAVDASLKRVEESSASSGALVQCLRAGDVSGAAKLLKQEPKQLERTKSDLQALWDLNWQKSSEGAGVANLASSDVEEMGWHLARAQEQNGNNATRGALDAGTKRRSDEEQKRVEAAGWETQTASSGVKVEVPKGWTWSEENKDRYHTASARSPLPGLWMSIEKGDRTSFSPAIPVDWHASEKRLQARYGSGYKPLKMETTTLLGRPAGLWEYELEKPGSPRLHKRYIGTADGWNSYVLSVTAPANGFEDWKRDFDRITGSLVLF